MKITSRVEAAQIAATTILAHLPSIPGVKPWSLERLQAGLASGGGLADHVGVDSISVDWERARSTGCDLSVHFESEGSPEEVAVDTDEGRTTKRVKFYKALVRLTWSSTGRDPSAARASAHLYSQVADLAALIETQLGELNIAEAR